MKNMNKNITLGIETRLHCTRILLIAIKLLFWDEIEIQEDESREKF